jgi:hypothetical protein
MTGIVVRKQDGYIVAISGAQRLEIEIDTNGVAAATLVSGRAIYVVKNEHGKLIEKVNSNEI